METKFKKQFLTVTKAMFLVFSPSLVAQAYIGYIFFHGGERERGAEICVATDNIDYVPN